MKAVITGASGFVGRSLVALLSADGVELLLAGRNAARLAELFPGHQTCDYDSLSDRAAVGYDTMVHLAVANNDSGLSDAGFFEANVELLDRLARVAAKAGVTRFVNVSSVHALDDRNQGAYARSKREGARRLATIPGLEAVTVYLPLVYSDGWSGKLGFLNRMPGPLARGLFHILKALKATVHVSRLADLVKADSAVPPQGALILSDGQGSNSVFQAAKRLVDLVFATLILVFFWWLLALVWLAIRLHSPGPGLFRQTRVGQGGRQFTCYKFRTMKQGTAQAGTHEVSAVAVTDGLGSFLRRSKLDELPQIFNILRDEISLVGPRPCLPVQVELVEARRRQGVLEVKPGITGLAQIEGIDMSDPHRLASRDADYVALQSLSLDLGILIATGLGRGQGDKIVKTA